MVVMFPMHVVPWGKKSLLGQNAPAGAAGAALLSASSRRRFFTVKISSSPLYCALGQVSHIDGTVLKLYFLPGEICFVSVAYKVLVSCGNEWKFDSNFLEHLERSINANNYWNLPE